MKTPGGFRTVLNNLALPWPHLLTYSHRTSLTLVCSLLLILLNVLPHATGQQTMLQTDQDSDRTWTFNQPGESYLEFEPDLTKNQQDQHYSLSFKTIRGSGLLLHHRIPDLKTVSSCHLAICVYVSVFVCAFVGGMYECVCACLNVCVSPTRPYAAVASCYITRSLI